MSDAFIEMAEFAGRACGIIVRDIAEISKPLAEGFRRGWHHAMTERAAATASTPPNEPTAPESA